MQEQRGSDVIKLTWIFRGEGSNGFCDEKRKRMGGRDLNLREKSAKCHTNVTRLDKTIKPRLRKFNLNPQITRDFWHLPSLDTGARVQTEHIVWGGNSRGCECIEMACMCVFTKFMHFKLFIGRAQLNQSERGVWLATNAQSRTSTLIAWNVNRENQRVCYRALESVWVGEKRKKDRRRLGSGRLLAGTPTRCEDLNCSGW